MPLYDERTVLEPANHTDRGDAIVTRFADRGRDRHAREDQFQSYDHYLSHYWTHRTARFVFIDTVAHGGSTIEISMVSEWRLSIPEFRAWYSGIGTVAAYHGNYAGGFEESGPGTYDDDHVKISDEGDQYRYRFTLDHAVSLEGTHLPLAIGQTMEFEASQFLAGVPEGRANYYGTTFLYEVGVGGLLPWDTRGTFEDASSLREDSVPIARRGWLGGRTTIPYDHSGEPDNAFMQMATNLAPMNGQAFVRGRRVHHTDMLDGSHDESAENGTFGSLVGLAGPRYMQTSCDGCHHRNGRAASPPEGTPLEAWVFKVGDDNGEPLAALGRRVQSFGVDGAGEGAVSISSWDDVDGLRRPVFAFSMGTPPRFSARIAPQLVGMGLLEAIAETDVLAWEDPADADGDGISGRGHRVADPVTGEIRLGRFGWKAGTTSVRHQTADALNGDMGVMTAMFPDPDCGVLQPDCGNEQGSELGDAFLDDLVRYVSLLGIRARRGLDDPEARAGEAQFDALGCGDCHRPVYETSAFHPYAELRSQTIHPYTDLLLHDMGDGLADSLGEGDAAGNEWRTPPLWGIGLGPCVTGGMEGPNQAQVCTPVESYLHDGRARTL
ncbi:MAG: di-heme oxidoredictase family protein, partial [Myxococcota bacterium]|nr:di-heme oxidoredictase family protein [Myxococcota bacterium]